jgi:hypothetical protein
MTKPVKWAAQLAHVREVSLLGTADLDFWKERLQKEDLLPSEQDGKARLLVIAADSKFMGLRVRVVSFSVLVSRPGEQTQRDAALLILAFNTIRFFAFCERVFFSTPYSHGDVRVSTAIPTSMQLLKGGEVVFGVAMHADASAPVREPSRSADDGWDGPVFLPARRPGQGNVFFARIRGHTRTYPFRHTDTLTIKPSQASEILQALVDSHFAPEEWIVREDASHAKSKTYRRSDAMVQMARVEVG